MYTTRFITPKEVKLINTLFSVHSKLVGEELTPNELDSMIKYYRSLIEVDLMKISMVFDENDPGYSYIRTEQSEDVAEITEILE
jgi:hypothetical protein